VCCCAFRYAGLPSHICSCVCCWNLVLTVVGSMLKYNTCIRSNCLLPMIWKADMYVNIDSSSIVASLEVPVEFCNFFYFACSVKTIILGAFI
jgi:hypothetical protein